MKQFIFTIMLLLLVELNGFSLPTERPCALIRSDRTTTARLLAKEEGNGQDPSPVPKRSDNKDVDVNVNVIPDADALTLTAVGFLLIGLNFFVFANLGDGGLAGAIASIINLSKQ